MPLRVLIIGVLNVLLCGGATLVIMNPPLNFSSFLGLVWSVGSIIAGLMMLNRSNIGRRLTILSPFISLVYLTVWRIILVMDYETHVKECACRSCTQLAINLSAYVIYILALYTLIVYFSLSRKNVREYFKPPTQEIEAES